MRTVILGLLLAGCGDKDDGTFGSGGGGTGDDSGTPSGDDGGSTDCDLVVVDFAGAVATATGTPFGRDDLRGAEVSGTFGYDPCLSDSNESDGFGTYTHGGDSLFTATIGDMVVTGSGRATVEVIVANSGFRFEDGGDGRTMQRDGVDAALDLGIYTAAADGDAFADDSLPDPAFFDASVAHTFSIDDADGGVLVQWDSLSVR